ncbi:hypothetical protein KR222_003099 [Zaprionus bogoriensis]|nr:hypothetical protein KR222_003099 [Zaprionus bogoriensis]
MAFVGRMNRPAKLDDCEIFTKSRSKLQVNQPSAEEHERPMSRPANCSRTYIRTYDLPSPVQRSGSNRARYVDGSASCCELNSMADTEMSTLRCNTNRSYETETETLTLCHSPTENSSERSSIAESNGSNEPEVEDEQQAPLLQLMERGSTTSMCSWEEETSVSNYEDTMTTEIELQSCGIPVLELGSEAPSIAYEHHGPLQQVKLMRESNEAYDNWLSGKRRQLQYRQQAEREQREQQAQKDALRRRLNEQRVREWCDQKQAQHSYSSTSSGKSRTTSSKPPQRAQLDKAVLRRRLQEWELNKLQQAQHQRRLRELEARRKQQQEQQRKEQAARAWQHWIKNVAQRPKPVPLNQGLKTLRGTISNIYVNPNQWVHINEKAAGQ